MEWIEIAGQEAQKVSRHPPISQVIVSWTGPNWPITPGHPPPTPTAWNTTLVPGLLVQLRTAWIVNVARPHLKANRGSFGQLSPSCEQFFDLVLSRLRSAHQQCNPFSTLSLVATLLPDPLYHQHACCPPPSHSIASVAPFHRPRLFRFPPSRSTVYPPWASSRMKSRASTPSSRASSRA